MITWSSGRAYSKPKTRSQRLIASYTVLRLTTRSFIPHYRYPTRHIDTTVAVEAQRRMCRAYYCPILEFLLRLHSVTSLPPPGMQLCRSVLSQSGCEVNMWARQVIKARRLILQRLQWAEANSELLLAAETWRV